MRKFFHKFYTYICAFYTLWGMMFHAFWLLGLLPNTWIIALFIFVASQYVLWISPGNFHKYGPSRRMFFNELLFHILPVIIIPIEISIKSTVLLIITSILYYLFHGKKRIKEIYSSPVEVIDEILHRK